MDVDGGSFLKVVIISKVIELLENSSKSHDIRNSDFTKKKFFEKNILGTHFAGIYLSLLSTI